MAKIASILSCPRLIFTENMFCVFRAMPPLGIPVHKHSGAFWEQSLSKLMYNMVNEDYDYIITLDYDSVFTRGDVEELIRLIESKPDALAIFPMQVKRNSSDILASLVPDDDGKIDLNQELMPVRTGNFGLTIIRVSELVKMSHPWFLSLPDTKDNHWQGNKVDADIHFWLKAEEHGLKSYLAPRIKLGHCQQMITWVDKDLKLVHQYLTDYEDNGRPKDV